MNKQIKTEIIINASREKVWQVLTDFTSYPTWNPFLINVEGEFKEGGRLKNTLQNGHKTMIFKPTILQIKQGESFSWLGSLFFKGLFDGLHSFEIENAGKDHVKLVHSESFSGLFSSFILKKIGTVTRNNFIQMNLALKNTAESN
ncbi:SRPBCC domain-containing protein [Flavihumibacter sp. CACIAM 22H1]|uniref:SRPBCC domain-containing protein n=1 Tax=Flavihumibacter sp. CACIAM 22H1 TaxID=1812911 RepID=UPI0007A833BE|nr:SRPBCC domain-containing protein [Flavihumibacter sp. CACIAM 22H1]KYP15985.1 MAG: polyketide cyclase/dehydrase [Flavihumibacter sp. CACIAM 22H1]